MPVDQTEAIILKTSPLGDIDKLVAFFSREKGLIRGVAKGARKFGNRFGSSLEPLSVDKIFYYEKEHRELVTISSCDLLESFFEMQTRPETAFLLGYFVELLEEFIPSRAREELLYRLLLSTLRGLKQGADQALAAAYFETWFLRLNGFLPAFEKCRQCGTKPEKRWLGPKKDGIFCDNCAPLKKDPVPSEMPVFLAWARKNAPAAGTTPQFSAGTMAEIRKALQSIIIYHMEKEPRSLQFLKG